MSLLHTDAAVLLVLRAGVLSTDAAVLRAGVLSGPLSAQTQASVHAPGCVALHACPGAEPAALVLIGVLLHIWLAAVLRDGLLPVATPISVSCVRSIVSFSQGTAPQTCLTSQAMSGGRSHTCTAPHTPHNTQ